MALCIPFEKGAQEAWRVLAPIIFVLLVFPLPLFATFLLTTFAFTFAFTFLGIGLLRFGGVTGVLGREAFEHFPLD